MAVTVWHIKEGGATHSILARFILLQDLHVTGVSMMANIIQKDAGEMPKQGAQGR